VIAINNSRCTECGICMQICSWTHFNEHNPHRSRIQIAAHWPHLPAISVCLACAKRECVEACPTEALTWDEWVRLDPAACDFCGACVTACPVQGIHPDPRTRLPLICDTCSGAFECTRWCPNDAIRIKGANP